MNNITKSIYPYLLDTRGPMNQPNDERFFGGGFLLPFVAGAAISAPFWFTAGMNRPNYPVYYPVPYYTPPYYQNYPMRPRPPYWRNDFIQ